MNSLVLLLQDVSLELESVASVSSTCHSGSSSTIGMGGRKDAMPVEGRGRKGVLDMLRLCKGSISHSEAGDFREGEACPLSDEDLDGIYND